MPTRAAKGVLATFPLDASREVVLRLARKTDKAGIVALYKAIYGENYPLEIIKDPKELDHCLTDPSYVWPLLVHEKTVVGSVIFCCDERQGISKVFGAVVQPEFRGNDLMRKAIGAGLEYLSSKKAWDVIYATTRTLSPAPEKLVRQLGFKTLGIFPNVRKVQSYETHGLNVYFNKGALEKRLECPRLVPEVQDFFVVARDICGLRDPHITERVTLPPPEPRNLDFKIIRDVALVNRRFDEAYDSGQLKFSFFPFHLPQVLLESADGNSQVYLHHNTYDNYGSIIGVHTDREDTAGFLHQTCETAAQLGFAYVELLVSAFDPLKQRQALDAHFLPCAYFPAMKPVANGKRMDYIVFSRSYENLDFTGLALSGDAQRFLEAFMKCWYWHLLKDEPDFTKLDAFATKL